ncbi:MAG: Crp/Fnr family transcriptional regulator [Firmicutes bacterium]|nr:Crp/Fnr family transcriptional regulator [Bacillota bacterium]
MKETIYQFYHDYLQIVDEDILNTLVEHSTIKTIRKNNHLYCIGDIVDTLYFFLDGFFYAYIQKTPRRKRIDSIGYVSGLPMLLYPELEPHMAAHNIYVTEDTRFISIDYETIKQVVDQSDRAKEINIHFLQQAFNFQLKLRNLREMPTSDRILYFFKEYGNISHKMTNTEIAAFLDMSRTEYVKIFRNIDLTNLE